MNLICSWMLFVTRNVRKTKTILYYLIIYLKNHKTQWNSREGTANSSRHVYWASHTETDALLPILPACRQPLLPACVFVTWDIVHHLRLFCSENLFVNWGSTVLLFQTSTGFWMSYAFFWVVHYNKKYSVNKILNSQKKRDTLWTRSSALVWRPQTSNETWTTL
jgi:hypothetical protein